MKAVGERGEFYTRALWRAIQLVAEVLDPFAVVVENPGTGAMCGEWEVGAAALLHCTRID
jgi:hypothetical protein